MSPQPAALATPAVRLEGVEKRYGDVVAVAGIDLEVRDGEFFSMLGDLIRNADLSRHYHRLRFGARFG